MVSSGRVGDIIYFTELEKGQRVSQYPVNRLPTCLSVFSSSPHSCLPRNIVLILSWGLKGQCDLVLIVISSSTLNKVLYSNFIVIFFFFFFFSGSIAIQDHSIYLGFMSFLSFLI